MISLKLPTKEQIIEYDIIGFAVLRNEVRAMDFTRINALLGDFKDIGLNGREKLFLTFSGYEYTKDEIYEIKEIRDYMARLLEQWPYYFYFASPKDMNRNVLFFCVVPNLSLMKGLPSNDLYDHLVNSKPITQVGTSYSISEETTNKILMPVVRYGEALGDTRVNTLRIIDSLLGEAGGAANTLDIPTDFSLLDYFQKLNEEYWLAYMDSMGMKRVIKPKRIQKFLEEDTLFTFALTLPNLMIALETKAGMSTNVFLINDKGYGEVCVNCGSSKVVVIVNDINKPESFDDRVFLPSMETYMVEKIKPMDSRYIQEFPIAINPKTDMWYCPNCKELHHFHYDNKLGLRYSI